MVECEFAHSVQMQQEMVSFNRYMVECEFCLYSTEWQLSGVLIDTWWNVNESSH